MRRNQRIDGTHRKVLILHGIRRPRAGEALACWHLRFLNGSRARRKLHNRHHLVIGNKGCLEDLFRLGIVVIHNEIRLGVGKHLLGAQRTVVEAQVTKQRAVIVRLFVVPKEQIVGSHRSGTCSSGYLHPVRIYDRLPTDFIRNGNQRVGKQLQAVLHLRTLAAPVSGVLEFQHVILYAAEQREIVIVAVDKSIVGSTQRP